MMAPEDLTSEIEQGEAWFAQFAEPQPPINCIRHIKGAVAREIQQHGHESPQTPPLSPDLLPRIRQAVRREFAARRPAFNRPPRMVQRLWPALASAALVALAVAAFKLTRVDGNKAQPETFVFELALDSELLQLEEQVEALELRVYAMDYLMFSESESSELKTTLEDLARPDYLLEFDIGTDG